MTYDARETSQQQGQPIELFEITMGSTTYFLTDAEGPQVIGVNTYDPVAVTRSEIRLGRDVSAEQLIVTIPSDHPFPRQFVGTLPGQRASLTIKRFHRDDSQVVVIFKGMVQSVAFTRDGTASEIVVLPLQASQGRQIPRFTFQGLCNHALYDARCKVPQSLFQYTGVAGTVTNAGLTITVPGLSSKPDGWANGGYIALGTSEFRLIVSHTGDTINLYYPFPANITGMSVDVFAGCDHSLNTCHTKFNNALNYGGFAFVPLKDIFSKGLN